MRKPKNYINNKTLFDEMSNYREKVIFAKEAGIPKPQIPTYVGQSLMLIAERLSRKGNFVNYSFRDEMISDGIENCILYIDNFDPAKSNNPFAYFTQIIKFAFIRRIQKEKKQQYIKIKNMQNSYIFSELSEHMKGHESENNGLTNSSFFDNEITSEFIRSFENSLEKKKKESKKVGIENFIEEDKNEQESLDS
jgi:hypothetical protein